MILLDMWLLGSDPVVLKLPTELLNILILLDMWLLGSDPVVLKLPTELLNI